MSSTSSMDTSQNSSFGQSDTSDKDKNKTKKQKKKMAKIEKKERELNLKLNEYTSDEEPQTKLNTDKQESKELDGNETDIELKQDVSTSEDEEETCTHVETDKQDNINIDDHLRNINQKLNNVLTKDDTNFIKQIIQETVSELKETLLASVLHRVETVEGELHDLAIKNETLKKEIKNLTKTNKTNEDKHKQELTEQNDKKTKVEEKFNEYEQYSRANNIRITMIPGDNKHEDSMVTTNKVVDLLNTKLDLQLTPNLIDIAHRLGPYKPGQNRRVIVKFVHRQIKHQVLFKRKMLKNTGISIFEDMTQLNGEILASARKKLPEKVDQAWFANGHIYIKWKTNTVERLEFKNYSYWKSLDWPKDAKVD